jgi:hypothetical protein
MAAIERDEKKPAKQARKAIAMVVIATPISALDEDSM